MTSKDFELADAVLRALVRLHHKASDDILSREVLPGGADVLDKSAYTQWGREKVYRYLIHQGLLYKEADEVEVIGTEDGDMEFTVMALSLLPDGIEAAEVGTLEFLKRRKERQDAQYKANIATARGFKVGRWGIWMAGIGLSVSLFNAFLFYRQVLDPPARPEQKEEQVRKGEQDIERHEPGGEIVRDTLTAGELLDTLR